MSKRWLLGLIVGLLVLLLGGEEVALARKAMVFSMLYLRGRDEERIAHIRPIPQVLARQIHRVERRISLGVMGPSSRPAGPASRPIRP